MRLLTALGLTAAVVIAGCAEPVASTMPITPLLTPVPSVSVPSFETPAEVMTATCQKIIAGVSQAFGAEIEWRQNRLSDEKFRQVLTDVNQQLRWAASEKDSSGFYFPTMPKDAQAIFGLFNNNLLEAELSLSAVVSAGVSDYRFVKRHLKEAKKDLSDWLNFYCESSD
jgi:hypothetical protein